MNVSNSKAYGIDTRTLHERRDPLGLRDDIVRADLLDELHGMVLPYRRYLRSPAHKHER